MKVSFLHHKALLLTIAVLATAPTARAADPIDASTRASALSLLAPSMAGGVLIAGSLSALQLSGQAVVASVEVVADGTVIVLQGVSATASAAGSASVRVAGNVSLAAGATVRVVAMSTGCALIAAGRMIAFIPNEVGQALVHQSRVTATREQ